MRRLKANAEFCFVFGAGKIRRLNQAYAKLLLSVQLQI